jgi:hypothetical protein
MSETIRYRAEAGDSYEAQPKAPGYPPNPRGTGTQRTIERRQRREWAVVNKGQRLADK